MVDVTLCAAGQRIHAHRIVLCSCSTLFQVNSLSWIEFDCMIAAQHTTHLALHNLQEVLSQVTEDHPTIILSDMSPQDIKSIIEFAYHGEIRVPVENIHNLLQTARSLKITGLTEVSIR